MNEKKNILVVDDSDVSQKLMSKILDPSRWNVDFVDTGKLATEAARKKFYDVIFMDVQMPEMNGLDATIIIKEHYKKENQKTLIIGLSAFAMKEDRQRALDSGMDDYLTKPVTKAILLEKLASWNF